MKTFLWLVKREFWEHRGGFLWAPVITGAVFTALYVMAIIAIEVVGAKHGFHINVGGDIGKAIQQANQGDLNHLGTFLDGTMYACVGMISLVMSFVLFFYCLGALYDDRRDRSILFWKSLPISDTSTVFSKVASATILAPVIATAVGVVAGLLLLLILATTLAFHGVNVWQLLMLAHPFKVITNVVGYIPLYLLWALPSVGWLLFCSAWSRSKPFLWAIVVPVVAGVMVWWFDIMGIFNQSTAWFWTHVVARGLLSVCPLVIFALAPQDLSSDSSNGMHSLDLFQSYQALGSANLWIGVVVGAGLIAGAIWFRRWRDDS